MKYTSLYLAALSILALETRLGSAKELDFLQTDPRFTGAEFNVNDPAHPNFWFYDQYDPARQALQNLYIEFIPVTTITLPNLIADSDAFYMPAPTHPELTTYPLSDAEISTLKQYAADGQYIGGRSLIFDLTNNPTPAMVNDLFFRLGFSAHMSTATVTGTTSYPNSAEPVISASAFIPPPNNNPPQGTPTCPFTMTNTPALDSLGNMRSLVNINGKSVVPYVEKADLSKTSGGYFFIFDPNYLPTWNSQSNEAKNFFINLVEYATQDETFAYIPPNTGHSANWNGGTGNWSAAQWTINPADASFPNNTGTHSYSAIINSGTVTLNVNATINSLTLGGTLQGASALTLGSGTVAGAYNLTGKTNLLGGYLTLGGTAHNAGAFAGTGILAIRPNATLISDAITLDQLAIAGTAIIRPSGTSTSKISALTLAADTTNAYTATLDLTNNSLILQSTSANKSTTLATLAAEILAANNHGTWTGAGITSSTNAADTTHTSTLALLDNADLHLSSFAGQSVDDNSLLITRALLGDADLSGTVDLADFDAWFTHVGASTYSYSNGDLNSDGIVDLADFDIWFNHVGASGILLAPQTLPTDSQRVPEPASLAIVVLGLGMLGRGQSRAQRPACRHFLSHISSKSILIKSGRLDSLFS